MSRRDLITVLNTPLVVELYQTWDNCNDDSVIGVGVLPLGNIWQAPLYYRCNTTGKTFTRNEDYVSHLATLPSLSSSSTAPVELRAHDSYVPLFKPNNKSNTGVNDNGIEVAQVRAVIYLEHIGIYSPNSSPTPNATIQNESQSHIKNSPPQSPTPNGSNGDIVQRILRTDEKERRKQTSTLKTKSVYHEKRNEQAEIDAINAAKQAQRMYEEQTAELMKSQSDYAELDAELRKTLLATERRERSLRDAQAASQRAAKQKSAELEILETRLKAESQHKILLEREKAEMYSRRLKQTENQLDVANKRCIQIENDFIEYRRCQQKTPESALRTEIAALQRENADANLQIEKLRNIISNERTGKVELKRRVMQLAAALRRTQEEELLRQQRENNTLRMKYAAQEHRMTLDGDRVRLGRLRKELDELRRQDAMSSYSTKPTTKQTKVKVNVDNININTPLRNLSPNVNASTKNVSQIPERVCSVDESESPAIYSPQYYVNELDITCAASEITRLKRERMQLLQTAGYDNNHPLVQQLDQAIQAEQEAGANVSMGVL